MSLALVVYILRSVLSRTEQENRVRRIMELMREGGVPFSEKSARTQVAYGAYYTISERDRAKHWKGKDNERKRAEEVMMTDLTCVSLINRRALGVLVEDKEKLATLEREIERFRLSHGIELRKNPVTESPAGVPPSSTKKCPFCAEEIKAEAVVCRWCGRDLPVASGYAEPPTRPKVGDISGLSRDVREKPLDVSGAGLVRTAAYLNAVHEAGMKWTTAEAALAALGEQFKTDEKMRESRTNEKMKSAISLMLCNGLAAVMLGVLDKNGNALEPPPGCRAIGELTATEALLARSFVAEYDEFMKTGDLNSLERALRAHPEFQRLCSEFDDEYEKVSKEVNDAAAKVK